VSKIHQLKRSVKRTSEKCGKQDLTYLTGGGFDFEIFTKGRFVLDLLPDKRDLFETEALADYASLYCSRDPSLSGPCA